MAGATDLAIRIATTMDATGINKADKSINKLQKSTVKLGRSLGIALSTTAIVAYGKSAVQAFASAEAQQQRLVQLLKVGVGATDSQIQALNEQADALERVGVVSAGNVTQVQSQLATFNLQASTIAALTPSILDYVTAEKGATASTEEFRSATNGLAQALNGNFTSLTRVGFVIDQNTRDLIKNGTEAQRTQAIVEVLDSTYKGFNASLRDTAAGGLQLLSNAGDAAKESIGEGLVNALARVGGGSEAADAAQAIENIAKAVNVTTLALGTAIGLINGFRQAYTNFLIDPLGTDIEMGGPTSSNRSASPAGTAMRMRQERERKALADNAAKREKERLALLKKQDNAQKKLTAEQRKQAALKKAGIVFDLDQIGLVAALKGKLSDEEKVRVMAQLALLNGNEKVAKELTNQILMAQDASGNLAKFLAALPNARNPFEYLDEYLEKLALKAAKLLNKTSISNVSPEAQLVINDINTATAQALAAAAAAEAEANRIARINETLTNAGLYSGAFPRSNPGDFRLAEERSNMTGPIQISLQVTGEGDITNAIAKGLQNQSLSTGNSTTINRSGGFL